MVRIPVKKVSLKIVFSDPVKINKLQEDENSWQVGFNDSGWRELNLPHDWSFEGKLN